MRFSDVLAQRARLLVHKTAVVEGDRRLSYQELHRRVSRVAAGLAESGVGPGDVVTSQLPNGIDALVLAFAANRAGAVHNPVVTSHRERELSFIRREAGTRLFVAGDLPSADAPAPRVEPAEPAAASFLLYTSGSSADPKGVLHTDGTLLAECEAQASYLQLTLDEVFVMPSPVGHVSGLLYGILLPVWLGATAVLLPRWDPTEFLAAVERERGTFCGGATPFLAGATDHPDLDRFDVSSLRVFPCGGADVPPDLIRRATERLGVRTGRGYGSSEFPSITSAAGPGEPLDKRAETDGRPIGTNEVEIRDGEIWARGRELFVGYRNPALDAEAFDERGFFRTGDLGTIDGDGYLTVTGRRKDIVIRSGEKFSAREVEDLLSRHPAVAAVAVIAVPDDLTGERACAVVVAESGAPPPTLDSLTSFLRDQGLSTRKLPERVEVVDALPMTASGKVQKHLLRERFTLHP